MPIPIENEDPNIPSTGAPSKPTTPEPTSTPQTTSLLGSKRRPELEIFADMNKKQQCLHNIPIKTQASSFSKNNNNKGSSTHSININSKTTNKTTSSQSLIVKKKSLPKKFSVKINPLMGSSFMLHLLTKKSTIYDLKESIFSKKGILPDSILLHCGDRVCDDSEFVIDCGRRVFGLSVRICSGIRLMNSFDCFDEEEEAEQMSRLGLDSSGNDDSSASSSDASEDEDEKDIDGGKAETSNAAKQLSFTPQNKQGLDIFSMKNQSEDSEQTRIPQTSSYHHSITHCNKCHKKCRIALKFTCKCSLTFCHLHRYPDTHNCTFDHSTLQRDRLFEANPKLDDSRV